MIKTPLMLLAPSALLHPGVKLMPQTFSKPLSLVARAAWLAVGLCGPWALASAATVVVPGTADPYLAGMPNGSTNGNDSAPAHSPILLTGIDLALGGQLTFTNAVGGTDRGGGCAVAAPYAGCDPIDGAEFWTHGGADQNGISTIRAPISALMGVFLGSDQPSLTAPPAGLNFQTLGLNFATLAPELKQLFFIGDGKTSTNVVQTFDIPVGATRLYLGTMDGFGWYNNTGTITFDVNQINAVPEPSSLLLMLAGMAGVGWCARRAQRAS